MIPKLRDSPKEVFFPPTTWPALLTLGQAQDVARATMLCVTCQWCLSACNGEPCPEQDYVRGCIHWKRRKT